MVSLSDIEKRTLDTLVDLIIPASEDGRFPAASEFDVWGYIGSVVPQFMAQFQQELARLNAQALAEYGTALSSLPQPDAQSLAQRLRASEPGVLEALAKQVVSCYYQQDQVLVGIGMEPRPPFPLGYDVHLGDLSLLEPVRKRGQMYRDV
ncbi:MAG: hypothetical protein ACI8PT_001302 [Gammaproteobacteria bacterium]|jgi:hypothetical protein